MILDHSLIVADRDYFPLLFRYKSQYPDLSFRLMSEEDFLDLASFRYVVDPIPLLLKQGINYIRAKKYAKILRVADLSKSDKLMAMYDSLKDKCIEKDPLSEYEMEHSHIVLFEMKEDYEVHSLLKRKGIAFEDISIADLGIPKQDHGGNKHPDIALFPNKFAQYSYIYSHVRESLLSDPSLANKIKVLIKDESDLFYVGLCSSLYGVDSYYVFSHPLSSEPKISQKMKQFYASKHFFFSDQELSDPALLSLSNIIDRFGLLSLPFDNAYSNLLEIISSLGLKGEGDEGGIAIGNDFVFDTSLSTYVTCYEYGVFYKVYDDKNVCSDEELMSLGANPSYVLTALDRMKKKNFIDYMGIALLSSVQEHLNDAIYSSQFNDEEGWENDVKRLKNDGGVETSASSRLLISKTIDASFYKRPLGVYRGYDHSFKGLRSFHLDPSRVWSVTNLETYINCPFKYYLSAYIPSSNSDHHSAYQGTLIHKVLEKVYDDDFVFESAFQEGVEAYKENMAKNHEEFSPLEEGYTEILKGWLEKIVFEIRVWKEHSSLKFSTPEASIKWSIIDGGEERNFKGRIDKIAFFEKDKERYYLILDYKTGKETFIPSVLFLGKSIQLPLYYLALSSEENRERYLHGASFGGFGIQNVFYKTPKNAFGKNGSTSLSESSLYSNLSIKGVFNGDEAFWSLADDTSFKEKKGEMANTHKGVFLNGAKTSFMNEKEGNISGQKGEGIDYPFVKLLADAKEGALFAIHNIEKGRFQIAPTSFNVKDKVSPKNLVCFFCPYKDICYHDMNDAVDYHNVIYEHLHGESFAIKKEGD